MRQFLTIMETTNASSMTPHEKSAALLFQLHYWLTAVRAESRSRTIRVATSTYLSLLLLGLLYFLMSRQRSILSEHDRRHKKTHLRTVFTNEGCIFGCYFKPKYLRDNSSIGV